MENIELAKLNKCACYNFRRTARALTQLYDEAFRPSGLRATQFALLMNIADNGPVSVTELADNLLLDQTTATHNLKPLKEQGLVESVRGEDARTRLITITPVGREKLMEMLPLWEKAQAQIVEGLGHQRYQGLLKEMKAVVALTR